MSARATRTARLDKLAEKSATVPPDERPKGCALRIDPATNPDGFALAAEQFGRAVRPRDVVMVVVQGDPATGGR